MAEPRITQYQLADALKGMRLAVRTGEGDLAAGGLVNGEVHVPDNVALHVFRTVGGEPHPTGPRLADADLCACCGNQFKPGQVCDSCREPRPSYASRAGTVLSLADKVVAVLDRESERSVKRTLRWVWDYLTDGDEPPF